MQFQNDQLFHDSMYTTELRRMELKSKKIQINNKKNSIFFLLIDAKMFLFFQFCTHSNELEKIQLVMPVLIACVSFQVDELRLQRMLLDMCICDAFYGNVYKAMDNDTYGELNMLNNPKISKIKNH